LGLSSVLARISNTGRMKVRFYQSSLKSPVNTCNLGSVCSDMVFDFFMQKLGEETTERE